MNFLLPMIRFSTESRTYNTSSKFNVTTNKGNIIPTVKTLPKICPKIQYIFYVRIYENYDFVNNIHISKITYISHDIFKKMY